MTTVYAEHQEDELIPPPQLVSQAKAHWQEFLPKMYRQYQKQDTTGQAQPSSRASVSSDESARRSGAQSERSAGNRAATVHPTDTRSERVTPKPEQAVTHTIPRQTIRLRHHKSKTLIKTIAKTFTITEDDDVGKGGLKPSSSKTLKPLSYLNSCSVRTAKPPKTNKKS